MSEINEGVHLGSFTPHSFCNNSVSYLELMLYEGGKKKVGILGSCLIHFHMLQSLAIQ